MSSLPDSAVLTRQEAYEAINDPVSGGAGASDRDAEVFLWVAAVSNRIDQLCGPVVTRTVVEKHDGGSRIIRPRVVPVHQVDQVTIDGTVTTTWTLVDDYRFVPAIEHDVRWPSGRRNIEITYQAGRAADTETVDPLFKLAAANVLNGLWAKYGGAWASGSDPFAEAGAGPQFFDELTHNVKRWLADEMLPPAVA